MVLCQGKNTGVGCHFLLQGIILTQGSNLYLLHLLYWQAEFFFFFLTIEPPGNRYWGYYNEWTHKLSPLANPTITPTYLKLNVLVCRDRQWTGKRIQKQGDVGEGLSREGGQARLVRWRLSLNLKDEKNTLSVVLGEWHFGQREQVQRSCGRYVWGAKDISLGWILVSEQGEWNERRERQQRPGLVGSW